MRKFLCHWEAQRLPNGHGQEIVSAESPYRAASLTRWLVLRKDWVRNSSQLGPENIVVTRVEELCA